VTSGRHTFINYPFPKNLLVDVKRGYYKAAAESVEQSLETKEKPQE